jgi:small subunit ribosomal protein S20
MAKAGDKNKKTKRPTAQKREIQNKKRRLINKARRSQIRTAIRSLDSVLKSAEAELTQENLSKVYSLVDKAVKNGLIKQNKADRTKARLTARVAKVSA